MKYSRIAFKITPLIIIIMITSCNSIKKLYLSEINESITESNINKGELYTENDFSTLPEPIQKYFKNCGYIGKEKIENIKIDYSNSFIRMSPEKKWIKIKYYQVNFTENPTRLVYITSRIFGLFPFEGRDKYQNGEGNMLIKLLKLFTVADAKGKEMDESALVTLLSDVLFMPSLAIQDKIEWDITDSNSVKAKFKDKGNEVSGIFIFNDNYEFIRFTTNDRFYMLKDGSYLKLKWTIEFNNYRDINGVKIPTDVKVIWHMDSGDFEYFKAKVIDIKYNIRE